MSDNDIKTARELLLDETPITPEFVADVHRQNLAGIEPTATIGYWRVVVFYGTEKQWRTVAYIKTVGQFRLLIRAVEVESDGK